MKFVIVSAPPKRGRHKLADYLNEYMKLRAKTVRVDFAKDEYTSPKVGAGCLRLAVKNNGLPIDVILRDNEVYLIRRDL